MGALPTATILSPWELAAETIVVKIRWFGLLIGYLLVNLDRADATQQALLNGILTLGAGYALLDTLYTLRGRVFLGNYPLLISFMEALFIGVLCYGQGGLESYFRYYYFLSLICCAIRYATWVTYLTCALHCASWLALFLALPAEQRQPLPFYLTLAVLVWVTWASSALARLLKQVGEHLSRLNQSLQAHQAELEARIAERTRELQEAQALLLHQEKMAAFGLLAAGISHEVGNPLTSISSLVQILQRRGLDSYTQEKLALVNEQLRRIQGTLRELINFSRPASTAYGHTSLADVLAEALNIAKYYQRTKGRRITLEVPADLPLLWARRDHLVQVFLNLILNAIDATARGGHIEIAATVQEPEVVVEVRDDGPGVPAEYHPRLFQPYFTTKKHGTGLGLFVTRKLVLDHGGRIEYAPRPGGGALFRVHLPLPERAPAPARPAASCRATGE
jgi:two-component system NtrC family sensor kinase